MVHEHNGKCKMNIGLASPEDLVTRTKKRYFAMIDELGREQGYLSTTDRELFKQQIKQKLGNESVADMVTYEQISTKIEELAQFAALELNYQFPSFYV